MTRTAGDIEALYQRTYRAVFARCRMLVGNDTDARDLTQEVYMAILERPDAFRGLSSEVSYLFGIATQRSISWLRSRLRRSEDWQRAVAQVLEATQPSGDPAARLEAKELLVQALESADENTGLMVFYHFADGLSQGEIAERMGLSRLTINQRLQAFRRANAARSMDGAAG